MPPRKMKVIDPRVNVIWVSTHRQCGIHCFSDNACHVWIDIYGFGGVELGIYPFFITVLRHGHDGLNVGTQCGLAQKPTGGEFIGKEGFAIDRSLRNRRGVGIVAPQLVQALNREVAIIAWMPSGALGTFV